MDEKKNILVIDNCATTQTIINCSLAYKQFNIICTDRDGKGSQIFNQRPIDIIITDLNNPSPKRLKTIAKLKMLKPQLKIIAMTRNNHNANNNNQKLIVNTLDSKILIKPFTSEELIKTIEQLI